MNNQTIDARYPNLIAYLDEADLVSLIENHTMAEADLIESAFEQIESAMINIHRAAEYTFNKVILEAIQSIWDNSRDLLDD